MGNRNSGPRPSPTALKVLRGFRADRINQREPRPPAGEIVTPATLSPLARPIWDRLAPICLVMGTLTVADVGAFAALCELQATLELACSAKGGARFRAVSKAGRIHPALKLERDTAAALRPYFEKFGLDPIGRARIVIPAAPEAPKSKWAGVLP
jgi:P27 family predicted phage terminase small subunit